MNKQTFIQLIQNPKGITSAQAEELEKVVAGFPYCQSAHILLAKHASDHGSMFADQKIKKAAAYTTDRKNLKKLLKGTIDSIPIESNTIPSIESPAKETNHAYERPFVVEQIEVQNISADKGLSENQRDKIIEELKENLNRLHQRKIKAAWDEIPEELIKPIEEEQKNSLIQDNNNLEVEPITEKSSIDNSISIAASPVLRKGITEFTQQPLNLSEPPIRTDETIIINEQVITTDLLIDYLGFLEEKRGIFRKNRKKEEGIIDKFIKEDPKIPKLDINNLPDTSVDLSEKSISASKGPVSENFAKILAIQGKSEKAIEIYEQLILKIPEKKAYFEAQIEKLKNKL